MKVADRLSHISKSLLQAFPICQAVIRDYRVQPGDPTTGWFKLVLKNDITVHVFEFLARGIIRKYAYTLLIDHEVVLRYDNAPHHRAISTFPHHKHVHGEVKPLENPSIGEFIREATELIKALKARCKEGVGT
ncbi:MAG TPA: hypothetical protein ENF34_03700 [Candidatus Bathyarchaeota archaeon]|nr:hypothetical protein [Candidatus Bathyarchaeota archaeon]